MDAESLKVKNPELLEYCGPTSVGGLISRIASESTEQPAMTPTHADLAAAMETVRKPVYKQIVDGPDGLIGYRTSAYAAACELIARHVAENAGRLRVVRPLEWENFFDDADAQYFSKTIFGMYRACRYEWSFQGKATRVNNLEEGKAACQADYDERIAAALAPAFPAKEQLK